MKKLILISFITFAVVASCQCAATTKVLDFAGDVVDCARAADPKASAELGPLIEALLLQTVTGKDLDWNAVKQLALNFSPELGGCLIAEATARLLAPRAPDPAAAKSGGVVLDPGALRAGFRELAAARFGGLRFATHGGVL
jgi:hypothetical protein